MDFRPEYNLRLILLVGWIFAEAWSISAASQAFGGLLVFTLLLLIAAAGLRLIQSQGFRTVTNMQQAMQRNELPAVDLLDALIVFIAGVLLVVPGFFSDSIALILIFSGIRRRLATRVSKFMQQQHPHFHTTVIIDGEYQTISQSAELELKHTDTNDDDPRPPETPQ